MCGGGWGTLEQPRVPKADCPARERRPFSLQNTEALPYLLPTLPNHFLHEISLACKAKGKAKACGKVPQEQPVCREQIQECRPPTLTQHGGLLQELEARLKRHLLQRGRAGLDPKAVQRLVDTLEAHVVGDQGEMAGINRNACHTGSNVRKDAALGQWLPTGSTPSSSTYSLPNRACPPFSLTALPPCSTATSRTGNRFHTGREK